MKDIIGKLMLYLSQHTSAKTARLLRLETSTSWCKPLKTGLKFNGLIMLPKLITGCHSKTVIMIELNRFSMVPTPLSAIKQ